MNRQHHLDSSRPVRCLYADQPTTRPHCQLTATVRYGTAALCPDCDARRSTLGKGVTPRRLPNPQPVDILHWIAQADEQTHQAHIQLRAAVQRARAQHHSWTAIGATLHITRQAAQQRFKQDHPTEG
jgi:hypothetical protein